MKNRKLFQVQS